MYTKKEAAGSGKPKAARTNKADRFNDLTFVQYELDADQKKLCKAWAITPQEIFEHMEGMITDGYKFGIRWDEFGDCVSCHITCPRDSGRVNDGLILSGRGISAFGAVKQVLWKHGIALDGDWTAFAERRGVGRDDLE